MIFLYINKTDALIGALELDSLLIPEFDEGNSEWKYVCFLRDGLVILNFCLIRNMGCGRKYCIRIGNHLFELPTNIDAIKKLTADLPNYPKLLTTVAICQAHIQILLSLYFRYKLIGACVRCSFTIFNNWIYIVSL